MHFIFRRTKTRLNYLVDIDICNDIDHWWLTVSFGKRISMPLFDKNQITKYLISKLNLQDKQCLYCALQTVFTIIKWSHITPISVVCCHKTQTRSITLNHVALYSNLIIVLSNIAFLLHIRISDEKLFQTNILKFVNMLKYSTHGVILIVFLPKHDTFLSKIVQYLSEIYQLTVNMTFQLEIYYY